MPQFDYSVFNWCTGLTPLEGYSNVWYLDDEMLPALLVIICVALRLVPFMPPNFAPVGATAVFAGRTMKPWMAVAVVAATMLAADYALSMIHGYESFNLVTPFVYAAFGLQILFGRLLREKKGGALGAATAGSLTFFLISNVGVWAAGGMYSPDLIGLTACFVAALPFFAPTIAGDIIWTMVLSAGYSVATSKAEEGSSWVPVKQVTAV